MNQAELRFLMSGLRIQPGKPRLIPNPERYRGSLLKTRDHVTLLVAEERLEMSENNAKHTRLYAERLTGDAILHGDGHKNTFEMASWWLDNDRGAIHKLFKVLVPRYRDYVGAYTRLLHAPLEADKNFRRKDVSRMVLELRGNPFPRLEYSNSRPNKSHLHNVLLAEAKKDWKRAAALKEVEQKKKNK